MAGKTEVLDGFYLLEKERLRSSDFKGIDDDNLFMLSEEQGIFYL
ncbi:MAG: hypothetical protein OP8BY_0907 [Candidatus Saccharicenans subterraneus]|uniref:Uncharacterized protein n=1 Tax=Candidatus Saccharicenans subterraneus TaxID=2508984 RepID=A0A3E2BQE8_9BACT|nr:MAG: hypothetical protein OP8BY_0907 [Candidatus Saccharicenans subterraneum]